MPTESPSSIYTVRFFSEQVSGSATSASIVVPLVLSMLNVKSVVDVGCGVGPWAAEFLANGVPEVWGIDGDYVDLSQLRIPQDRFLARDLTKSIQIDRTFDLAVCLEVAEHLPESRADGLIADLTSVAPCILFSAAVPGAGGTHHINEQYLSYWTERFLKRGYEGVDAIRSLDSRRRLGGMVLPAEYGSVCRPRTSLARPGHPESSDHHSSRLV